MMNTNTNFKKVINPLKTKYGQVFLKIEQRTNEAGLPVLSISGVEAPKRNGNCAGSCGQILDVLLDKEATVTPGWDVDQILRLHSIWKKYHLNDLQAGTKAQAKAIKKQFKEYPGYGKACEYLKSIDLYKDKEENNYVYGSAWLYMEIPDEAIEFLKSLPDTKVRPAWV